MTPIENPTFLSAMVDGMIRGAGTGGAIVGLLASIGILFAGVGLLGYVLLLILEPIIKWHDARMDAIDAEEVTDHAEPDPEYRADAPNPGRHAKRMAGRD